MTDPRRPRPRRLARALAATVAAAAVAAVAPLSASPSAAAAQARLCFPVEGPTIEGSPNAVPAAATYWTDTFGAPRSGGRTHEGQDIMSVRGVKMRRLLAATDGTILEIVFDNASGNRVVLQGDDGWFYVYIHVNNDSPGTDDGRATRDQAFAPGLAVGQRVTRGQFIAYLGDSGNAESAGAHNHFETRQPLQPGQSGYGRTPTPSWAWSYATAVNARDALRNAERCDPPRFAPFTGVDELVERQYRDFLGRAPDTAGRQYWSDQIHSDRVTPLALVSSMLGSAEFKGVVAPVARLYRAYFDRLPDTDGLRFWVGEVSSGRRSLAAVSQIFATSPEFTATYGSLDDEAFVALVYANVLGRDAEADGLAFWAGELAERRRTRGQVMLGFSESAEYTAATSEWVQVVAAYLGMLGRSPDDDGLAYWIEQGVDVLSGGIWTSPEYAARVSALRTP